MQLNNKARYTLICALSKNKYKKICKLKLANEIWDSLKKIHLVKKIVTLMPQFKSFTMMDGETMNDMFGRMKVLLNGL